MHNEVGAESNRVSHPRADGQKTTSMNISTRVYDNITYIIMFIQTSEFIIFCVIIMDVLRVVSESLSRRTETFVSMRILNNEM